MTLNILTVEYGPTFRKGEVNQIEFDQIRRIKQNLLGSKFEPAFPFRLQTKGFPEEKFQQNEKTFRN